MGWDIRWGYHCLADRYIPYPTPRHSPNSSNDPDEEKSCSAIQTELLPVWDPCYPPDISDISAVISLTISLPSPILSSLYITSSPTSPSQHTPGGSTAGRDSLGKYDRHQRLHKNWRNIPHNLTKSLTDRKPAAVAPGWSVIPVVLSSVSLPQVTHRVACLPHSGHQSSMWLPGNRWQQDSD